jgi:hypothetical protein
VNPSFCLALAAVLVSPVASRAAVSYTAPLGLYSQDFNALPNTGTVTLPGSATTGTQLPIPGVTDWELAKRGGTGSADVALWTTPATGGRFYSSGTDAADRALSSLASGTFIGAIGTSFVNDTGSTLTAFTITFSREIWAVQGTSQASPTGDLADRLSFAYGISGNGPSATDYLTSAAMIPFTDLDAVSPAENMLLAVASNTNPDRTRDGNSPDWKTTVSATVSGITWDPGQTLFLRWSDSDTVGFDAIVGVDDFSFTAAIPEPSTGFLMAAALAFGGFRRRRA